MFVIKSIKIDGETFDWSKYCIEKTKYFFNLEDTKIPKEPRKFHTKEEALEVGKRIADFYCPTRYELIIKECA